jgi:SAM-dependent methyltransferase
MTAAQGASNPPEDPTNRGGTEERARVTAGRSSDAIYRMVARALARRHPGGGDLLDLGCGAGRLWSFVAGQFDRYLGVDVVRHDGFPDAGEFHRVDLDTGRVDLPDAVAAAAVAVETIEHVENPRALARELTRLARPGGLVLITTPSQVSMMAKISLCLRNVFPAFVERPGLYPAHITALLEVDLVRILRECGLVDVEVIYTDHGRIPLTARNWPSFFRGRAFSDNLGVVARKPG